uniref:TMK1 n=1 Tax=Arundo donax TaxID=35708 RepID=A0A0A9HHR7_ARUDO
MKSGSVPETLAPLAEKLLREVQPARSAESGHGSSGLWSIWKSASEVSPLKKSAGMEVKLLLSRSTTCSESSPASEGSGPESELEKTSRRLSAVRLRTSGASVPVRLRPPTWILVTRPVESQDTPSHGFGEQGSPARSQPSALSAPSAFATARIAAASDGDVSAPTASTRASTTGAHQNPATPPRSRRRRRTVKAVGDGIAVEGGGWGEKRREKQE